MERSTILPDHWMLLLHSYHIMFMSQWMHHHSISTYLGVYWSREELYVCWQQRSEVEKVTVSKHLYDIVVCHDSFSQLLGQQIITLCNCVVAQSAAFKSIPHSHRHRPAARTVQHQSFLVERKRLTVTGPSTTATHHGSLAPLFSKSKEASEATFGYLWVSPTTPQQLLQQRACPCFT